MLDFIARYCTLQLIQKNVIDEKKKNIFIYGFQLFFSTASSIISMLIISFATGNFVYGIIYLFVFMSLRITANGYHANTFGGCFIVTNSVFLIYLLLIENYSKFSINVGVNIFFLIISFIYIWEKAPIEHPNHKLSSRKRDANQVAARMIILGDMALVLLLTKLHFLKIVYAISITIYIVTLMMLVKSKDFVT